ncbi:MAG TPA: NADH-quinone oxidoreductase subunit NuoE [Armatimonadota bacterium]|nr:NADH-quinone oxidoreductase subunit NuoE [Armatimonadota bacterium]HOS42108.1 NADH-quinone oxidoreductase subunit NuoE [Armatimonadota bacterium]
MTTHVCECASAVERIVRAFPSGRREALIPLLQAVQEEFGYLPQDALRAIARHLNLPAAKVFGVATFYNQFRLKPVGAHTIRVCRGTACHVRGSKQLLDAVADHLGVTPGETTADGEFTLETVACIGACSIAPVVMVDGDFHGAVKSNAVAKLLEPYREK